MPYSEHACFRVEGPTRLDQVRPLAQRCPVRRYSRGVEPKPQDFRRVFIKGAVAQLSGTIAYFSDDRAGSQEVVFPRRRPFRDGSHSCQEMPDIIGVAVRKPEFI